MPRLGRVEPANVERSTSSPFRDALAVVAAGSSRSAAARLSAAGGAVLLRADLQPNAGDTATATPEASPTWLGEEAAEPAQLKAMPARCPADRMTCWPVRARGGNVKNNDPSLAKPTALA
jgi:hypothetical protein